MRKALLAAVAPLLVWTTPAYGWSWPVDGPVLRPFALGDNPYAGGQHRGIDVAAPAGSAVSAPVAGEVAFAGSVPTGGRTVTIRTADGWSVTLLHLGSVTVRRGDGVAEREPVGAVGPSGDPEHGEPYVHVGIRRTDEEHGYVDPLLLLPGREAPATAAERADAAAPAPDAKPDAVGDPPAPAAGGATLAPPAEPASSAPGATSAVAPPRAAGAGSTPVPPGQPDGARRGRAPAAAASARADGPHAARLRETIGPARNRSRPPPLRVADAPARFAAERRVRPAPAQSGHRTRRGLAPRATLAASPLRARRSPVPPRVSAATAGVASQASVTGVRDRAGGLPGELAPAAVLPLLVAVGLLARRRRSAERDGIEVAAAPHAPCPLGRRRHRAGGCGRIVRRPRVLRARPPLPRKPVRIRH